MAQADSICMIDGIYLWWNPDTMGYTVRRGHPLLAARLRPILSRYSPRLRSRQSLMLRGSAGREHACAATNSPTASGIHQCGGPAAGHGMPAGLGHAEKRLCLKLMDVREERSCSANTWQANHPEF